MTLEEIKKAIAEGKTVHWASTAYEVRCNSEGYHYIFCTLNDNCCGLTWLDGVTMNGDEDQFFIASMEQQMTPEKMQVIINIQNISAFLGKEMPFDNLENKSLMALRLFQEDLLEKYNEKVVSNGD